MQNYYAHKILIKTFTYRHVSLFLSPKSIFVGYKSILRPWLRCSIPTDISYQKFTKLTYSIYRHIYVYIICLTKYCRKNISEYKYIISILNLLELTHFSFKTTKFKYIHLFCKMNFLFSLFIFLPLQIFYIISQMEQGYQFIKRQARWAT